MKLLLNQYLFSIAIRNPIYSISVNSLEIYTIVLKHKILFSNDTFNLIMCFKDIAARLLRQIKKQLS